jgi:catechol 2,3-dioxygenase-like lactoylglutathione lyase family enzyme
MKRLLILISLIHFHRQVYSQDHLPSKDQRTMKLNAGIITSKLAETKAFYINTLGFGVTFENDFYLLLHTPGHEAELSFLLPEHPSQQALFHQPFAGQGMYLTIEVENVDQLYAALQEKGIEIKIEIRDEPWGDRHFAIQDPNGIGIDMVQYAAPENK